jgi:hypothetical protein
MATVIAPDVKAALSPILAQDITELSSRTESKNLQLILTVE